MKNSRKHAKRFRELISTLGEQFEVPSPEHVDPIAQLIIGFLMADASSTLADQAFGKIRAYFVDYNDLRSCIPDELVAVIGERYPQGQQRCVRLLATLNSLYQRENRIAFAEDLAMLDLERAEAYLCSLAGMSRYVYGQVMLLAFGRPILPVDENLQRTLLKHELIDRKADIPEIQRWISVQFRHLKYPPREVHLLLQGWVEEQVEATEAVEPSS